MLCKESNHSYYCSFTMKGIYKKAQNMCSNVNIVLFSRYITANKREVFMTGSLCYNAYYIFKEFFNYPKQLSIVRTM